MLIEPCTKISHRCNSPDQSITSWITVNIDLSYYCWREPVILKLVLSLLSGRSYTIFTLDQKVIKLYKCTELLRRNHRSPSPLRTATKGVKQHVLRSPSALTTDQVKYLFAVFIETERTALGKIIQYFS